MKLVSAIFILVLCLLAVAYAQRPNYGLSANFARKAYPQSPETAQILGYQNNYGVQQYRYAFLTSNDIFQEQQGELTNEGLVVRGQYSYLAPDGLQYTQRYVADQNGYQPEEPEQGPGGLPPAATATLLGG